MLLTPGSLFGLLICWLLFQWIIHIERKCLGVFLGVSSQYTMQGSHICLEENMRPWILLSSCKWHAADPRGQFWTPHLLIIVSMDYTYWEEVFRCIFWCFITVYLSHWSQCVQWGMTMLCSAPIVNSPCALWSRSMSSWSLEKIRP